MTYPNWMNKTANFKTIDVRGIQGNFFHGIKKQAANTAVGSCDNNCKIPSLRTT